MRRGLVVVPNAGPWTGRRGEVIGDGRLHDGRDGIRVRFFDDGWPKEGLYDERWLTVHEKAEEQR